jgi:hypothetical protein
MKPDAAAINQQIDAIWIAFRDQVGEAFRAAHEVAEPAGRSPAWQQVCARWNVALISDAERQQVRAAQRPLRGAAVMELQEVTSRIVGLHRAAVKRIDPWDAGAAVESKHQRLVNLIDRTESELLQAYRDAVLPKAAGMFANVFVGTSGSPRPATQGASSYTITCRWCGAPRLSARDLMCGYCDQSLV